jgi:acetyl-CoA synthetase
LASRSIPEAWEWYYRTVGDSRCPSSTPGGKPKPAPRSSPICPAPRDETRLSATRPFFGIKPALVDDKGAFLEGAASGNLVLLDSWPGQMRTVYGDHQRFFETYFRTYPGMYFTGDGCRRDEDGYYWITGRVDDVLNVSGTASAPPKSKARSSPIRKSPKPPSSAIRTTSKARAFIVMSR